MAARLVITRDGHEVRDLLLDGRRLTLGRHPDNDIVLAHATVSSRHASITPDGPVLIMDDLGSSNGTLVNGERVTRAALLPGDRIGIAVFELTLVAPLAATPPAQAAAALQILNGPRAGTTLSLLKPMTTLGSPGVAIVIISRGEAAYHIEQVVGQGGASIDGIPLAAGARPLQDGELLDITGTRMRFVSAAAQA